MRRLTSETPESVPAHHSHFMTWVIKLTKLCNLRCRYCYEFESLADPRRIDNGGLQKCFAFIAKFCHQQRSKPILCFHGGEPLSLSLSYWEQLFLNLDDCLLSDIATICVQTNLFAPRWDVIDFLLSKGVKISVSFDVANSDRRTVAGCESTVRVLENLDRLYEAGGVSGGIAVLTSNSVPYANEIFDFYNKTAIPLRLLPFYRQANEDQKSEFSLDLSTIENTYKQILDLWLSSGLGSSIEPIGQATRIALNAAKAKAPENKFDKNSRENCLVVDTNLDVFSVGTVYSTAFCYGNAGRHTVQEVLESEGRRSAIARARENMKVCNDCAYAGHCSGYPMGEATDIELDALRQAGRPCAMASLIELCGSAVREVEDEISTGFFDPKSA